jgi:hypothetical protein
MKQPLINLALFRQLECSGLQVAYTARNKKIVRAVVIDPLQRLLDKRLIDSEEHWASRMYRRDFDLLEKTNHSRPIYDVSACATSVNKPRDFLTISDDRVTASKRVDDVKRLVYLLSARRVRKMRKIRPDIFKSETAHQEVLKYIFEMRCSISHTERLSGINHDLIAKKAKDIAKAILQYYKKPVDN